MRRLILIALGGMIALGLLGCGSKETKTTAVEVENPKEKAQQAAPPHVAPAPPPAPAPATTTKDGWKVTENGLEYKDKKVGKGPEVKVGDYVTVNYTGWLDNGEVFDSSKKPGREPFEFTVGTGQVIAGWDEGLQGMKVGGQRELKIPSRLGYGDAGQEPVIPPNATLHFDIELLKIGQ